ncbi:MAG: deaminase, partial [Gammaproteobacteria bacterium]
VALRAGGLYLENYRLLNTTLYVTLEPCAMCLGAIIHAPVSRLVYAANDPKTGMLGGALNLLDILPWSHPLTVEGGLFAEQSVALLQDFFKSRR